MKKSKWLLLLLILLGLLAGSLIGYWLDAVPGLSFLTNAIETDWKPSFDLHVIAIDLSIHINISLLSIIGMFVAIWWYRKL
ncbi:MAG: DUF4321 domain-containing protein [Candidatus Pristimantibacillus lignocellulolyticus]|uniref:DUF4321 domain-containing protein n=1 Tax=Candidatus Pristimantibacillus lignocellulolyticus TaxID=2994561 RepID=A0A9J6Z9M3_9BACL|nr:MAG: DUF4321 domain-containing protein [Candidatus Pristimantibacillus lignocellulolyticus]